MVAYCLRVLRVGVCVCFLLIAAFSPQAKEAEKKESGAVAAPLPQSASLTVQSASQGQESLRSATDAVLSASSSVDPMVAALQSYWDTKTPSETSSIDTGVSGTGPTMQDSSLTQSLGQMLISLAFVIMLGLAVAWFARRFFVKKHTLGGTHIEWMSSYALSQKSRVHLIRVGNQHFLVGEGGNSLSLISKVDMDLDEPSARFDEEEDFSSSETQYASEPQGVSADFQSQLSHWQNSLENQNIRQELNASLLFLKGLTQRLRSKGGQNA